jgi:sec-independent protein translocase protein TatC
MSRAARDIDPDDMFSDTRMSFGDHLEDLRMHLWRAIIGFLVGLVISLFIGKDVLVFIAKPVERELLGFYQRRTEKIQQRLTDENDTSLEQTNKAKEIELQFNRRELQKILGIAVAAQEPEPSGDDWVAMPFRVKPLDLAIATSEAERLIIRPSQLATMNITEAFMVYFKVCMVCAVVIGSPWIFWQIWSFVAAGLYSHEKRYINVYLPFSLGLFLAGFFICEFAVIPNAIRILLEFNEWIGLEPDLRLNEWLSFALMLPLVFGVSFQTPLVMLFLAKLGIFDFAAFRRFRRIAYFSMAVFAAIITPTPDAWTMLFMWVPMCALYELGIYLAILAVRKQNLDIETPDSDDVIEV